MNSLEQKMISLLKELKSHHHVTAVRAEFEEEGARIEEVMRLKDIAVHAGLDFHLKIGGCAAIKDMLDSINLGVQKIIVPMIETPYAMQKFVKTARKVYSKVLNNIQLLINIETIVGYNYFDEMLDLPEIESIAGVVIGRVDLVGSLGLGRDQVNSQKILEMSLAIAAKSKAKNLSVIVGGGVSADSMGFFKSFPLNHLDHYETRKLAFDCPGALNNSEEAFIKAVEFELMWLQNKRDYYGAIAKEDQERLQLMTNRLNSSLNRSGENQEAFSTQCSTEKM